MKSLRLNGTQLCAPLTAAFQAWLAGINDRSVDNCAPTPDPDPDPDPDPVVDRIRINPTSATLIEVGQTKLLTATVYDTDNVEIPGAMVTWTSSDPAVASVDTNGLVTAVARGNATITAALDGKSDSAAISVVLPAARVEVDPSTATLTIVGATKQLTAKVYDTNDDVITDAPVAWTSGDPSVATVNRIGMVTAIGSGAATITATSEGKSDSATISVELTGARIEIELSKDKLTSVGATEQLSAKVYDSNENVIADAPVAWSSSDPSVATVDANGLVTAVSRGNTTITATSGIQSANVVITVDLPADQIDIDPDSETLTSVGATVQLTATVYDENNDVIEDATVAWESDDTSVATVSTSGLVTAVSRGTTTITATSGDKSKTASITVDLPADQIDIDPDSETLTSVGRDGAVVCNGLRRKQRYHHRSDGNLGERQYERGDGGFERARDGRGGRLNRNHRDLGRRVGQRNHFGRTACWKHRNRSSVGDVDGRGRYGAAYRYGLRREQRYRIGRDGNLGEQRPERGDDIHKWTRNRRCPWQHDHNRDIRERV